MLKYNILVNLLLLFLNRVLVREAGVIVKRLEMCDLNPNYAAIINATFKTIDKKQYYSATYIYKRDFDDTIRTKVSVKMITGKNTVHLLDINEKKSCTALHKYMGEFAYDVERNAGLITGKCPIPKGKDEVHDAFLDFRKFTTVSNFPFGHLLFTLWFYDVHNKQICCLETEAEHVY